MRDISTAGPILALSIRQPWASLIVEGRKDIENRTWRTEHRGPILIHAAKTPDHEARDRLCRYGDPSGGIIGIAEVVDCVTGHQSPWFSGPIGWVLANPRRLKLTPCAGRLGLFRPELPPPLDRLVCLSQVMPFLERGEDQALEEEDEDGGRQPRLGPCLEGRAE